MDQKLTIKLDIKVIEKAKSYAKSRKTSLSKLIESYLRHLTSGNNPEGEEITTLVKSLSGIVRDSTWEEAEEMHKVHLNKKYTTEND